MKKNKNGFTLIEMLAAVGVLALLVGFVVPRVVDLLRDSQDSTLTIQEKNIAGIAEQFIEENCIHPVGERATLCDSDDVGLSLGKATNGFYYVYGKLNIQTLINEDMMDEISDCPNGYVEITGDSTTGDMTYKTYLNCNFGSTEGYNN